MQKYLVLLRAINVGGNSIIKMSDLKSCLTEAGFSNVKTFIQSGNVILESAETNTVKLTDQIEKLLSQKFNYQSKIVLRSLAQMQQIISQAPKWWGRDSDYKHNLLFIKEPMTAEEALAQIGSPKVGIELAEAGAGVIYLSTSIKDATKANFIKVVGKPVYKSMTIRNYNTSVKLLELMQ